MLAVLPHCMKWENKATHRPTYFEEEDREAGAQRDHATRYPWSHALPLMWVGVHTARTLFSSLAAAAVFRQQSLASQQLLLCHREPAMAGLALFSVFQPNPERALNR